LAHTDFFEEEPQCEKRSHPTRCILKDCEGKPQIIHCNLLSK
jgi:hypothetical protein